jgi:hypothetical protein
MGERRHDPDRAGPSSSQFRVPEAGVPGRAVRLELGLGAGYLPGVFEAAGVPFGAGGERVRKLEATLAATRPPTWHGIPP